MKNIYITDLDHTFLRGDLSISPFTKQVWNNYAKNSIMSIATARTYKKSMQFLHDIEINAPMILLDGALIATKEKKIIDTKFVSKEVADTIIDEGAKVGIYPFVLSLDEGDLNEAFLHSDILNSYQQEVLTRYTADDNLIKRKNIRAMQKNFKVVYMGDEDLLRELEMKLKAIFGETLKFILAPEAYVGCYFLTILHKDADKSHGVQSISEYLGFDLNKLTVFGDNFNDVGMFALAGASVAVNNAQEGVKKLATFTSLYTNEEDSVAKYLESLKNE